jgi:hypothetical protein
VRGFAAAALFAALLAALHAIPANANTTRPATGAQPINVSALPPAEVQELLSGVPLEDVSATQLGELLAKLPGLAALPSGQLQEALTKAIETLAGKGDTLEALSNPSELVPKLEAQLGELLSLPELLSLLGEGQSLATLLSSGLGSPEATQLLGGLLSTSSNPKQLVEQLLAALSPEKLEGLLGTTLSSEPVSAGTVGELTGKLGVTDQELAEALGTTEEDLPETALALTKPLTDGKTLAALDGVGGLSFSLIEHAKEVAGGGGSGGTGGGTGGSGGAGGGSGGSGGSGGAGSTGSGGSGDGSSGTPGATTTVVVNEPAPAAAAAPIDQRTSAKLEILSRRVSGRSVTLLVQVPSAGTVTIAGSGVRSLRSQASRAERITLRTSLSQAGVASLRRHARRLKVELKATFKPVDGAASSADTTVAFG